jgi:hypothetical protein
MSLLAETANLVPFTSEVEARRIREKIRFSYGRPKFVLIAPNAIENVNRDSQDDKDLLAAAAPAPFPQYESNPEQPDEKEAPKKQARRRRGGRKLRYVPLVTGSFASVDSHQDNEDKGDPLAAAGHVARREGKQFTALPPPPPQRKADKLEPLKKIPGRRRNGGIGGDGDDDGSDGEEERRKKEAVVAESTSAPVAKKDSGSVDEIPLKQEYLLPEDEEVKEIDYSIFETDPYRDWEVWQARRQQRSQAWRDFQKSERLFIEAEKKRIANSKRTVKARSGIRETATLDPTWSISRNEYWVDKNVVEWSGTLT